MLVVPNLEALAANGIFRTPDRDYPLGIWATDCQCQVLGTSVRVPRQRPVLRTNAPVSCSLGTHLNRNLLLPVQWDGTGRVLDGEIETWNDVKV